MTAKRRGKWHVDFALPNGRRIRRVAEKQTRRGAEAEEAQLRAELLASLSSTSKKSDEREEVRFTDFSVEWLKTYAVTNNKYSTVVSKEQILRCHLIPAFGQLRLSDINLQRIERYKATKLSGQRTLSPKTVNNHLTVLRCCLATAEEWGFLETVPKIKWLRPPPPRFDFLTFEEADQLLAKVEDEWHPMILTAMRTGLRQGELCALRWEDVDLEEKMVHVRRSVWKGHISTPKNNRFRSVPLTNEVVAALDQHRHQRSELVFCGQGGSMFTYTAIRSPIWRACKRAGLRKVQWHILRHSFASHLVMRGVPLMAVQELLGHATLTMTLRYAHLAPSAHREAIAVLEESTHEGRKSKDSVRENWTNSGPSADENLETTDYP